MPTLLTRTTPTLLYVVDPDRPDLFDHLATNFADEPEVEVRFDRRVGDRRLLTQPVGHDRRRGERRHHRLDEATRPLGWIVVRLRR